MFLPDTNIFLEILLQQQVAWMKRSVIQERVARATCRMIENVLNAYSHPPQDDVLAMCNFTDEIVE